MLLVPLRENPHCAALEGAGGSAGQRQPAQPGVPSAASLPSGRTVEQQDAERSHRQEFLAGGRKNTRLHLLFAVEFSGDD